MAVIVMRRVVVMFVGMMFVAVMFVVVVLVNVLRVAVGRVAVRFGICMAMRVVIVISIVIVTFGLRLPAAIFRVLRMRWWLLRRGRCGICECGCCEGQEQQAAMGLGRHAAMLDPAPATASGASWGGGATAAAAMADASPGTSKAMIIASAHAPPDGVRSSLRMKST